MRGLERKEIIVREEKGKTQSEKKNDNKRKKTKRHKDIE